MNEKALSPCPFCGSTAFILFEFLGHAFVICTTCKANGPHGSDRESAARLWEQTKDRPQAETNALPPYLQKRQALNAAAKSYLDQFDFDDRDTYHTRLGLLIDFIETLTQPQTTEAAQ